MIVRVGGILAKRYGRTDSWLIKWNRDHRRIVMKESGVAEVIRYLPANFGAHQDCMSDRSCLRLISEIRLVKKIAAPRGVVVSRKINAGLICINTAGHKVLVEATVNPERTAIVNIQIANLVIDYRRRKIHASAHATLIRVAEESCALNIGRPSAK